MSAKISRAGLRLRASVATASRRMYRLGVLGMTDAEIVECGQELAAIARAGPARNPLRGHRRRPAAQVQPRRPLVRRPRRESNENAADWTHGIASATSTSPFGNVCCSIVDEVADKGTSRSSWSA